MKDYGISIKRQEHIAVITLDRPAKQNALDQHMCDRLDKVVAKLKSNLPCVIILTARKVGAKEALQLGLTNRISAPGKALEEALSPALSIAQNGPRAVRHALFVIRKTGDLITQEALELETKKQSPSLRVVKASMAFPLFSRGKNPILMSQTDNETQASETKCTEACRTNYTRHKAPWYGEYSSESE